MCDLGIGVTSTSDGGAIQAGNTDSEDGDVQSEYHGGIGDASEGIGDILEVSNGHLLVPGLTGTQDQSVKITARSSSRTKPARKDTPSLLRPGRQ